MPSYTRGILRDVATFVAVNNANVYYGFNTKDFSPLTGVSAATLSTDLGHLSAEALPAGALLILGARSPKPPRVKKIINNNPSVAQQGTASTYCAYNKVRSAIAKGWKLAKEGRGVTLSNNTRTTTVAVELASGLLICEPKNTADVVAYKEELGLQIPSELTASERGRLVMYSTMPKPTRLKKKLEQGKTVTMPCSSAFVADALAAGWSFVSGEYDINVTAPNPTP